MLPVTVGIPRALLFHQYGPLWERFYRELGAEVIISPPTNKTTLDLGSKSAVDEACLPVKLCHGHLVTLHDRVDFIFLPRLVSVEKDAYICPKFLGLPEMVRFTIPDLPPLLAPTVNFRQGFRHLPQVLYHAAAPVTKNWWRITRAWLAAWGEYTKAKMKPAAPDHLSALTLGVLAHPYNLHDPFINMGLLQKLRDQNISLVTPDDLPPQVIEQRARQFPRHMFWTYGKKLLSAGLYLLEQRKVDGIINLAAFGCGPDSLIGELLERAARRRGEFPFLFLTLDEHSGEAGFDTRIEAFTDMVKRRKAG